MLLWSIARIFLGGTLGLALSGGVLAAEPLLVLRPVRLVLPYPPGGGGDFTGRELAHQLTQLWGQQVVVDNRPGAGTAIAHNIVAKAAPDGYTLGLGSSGGMVLLNVMSQKVPYQSPQDFSTLGQVVSLPFVVSIHAALPVNTISELIALAKAQPGKLNFGSPGTGTPNHLGGELLKMMASIQMVHVAYKGGGLAATDLATGAIQIFFTPIQAVLPFMSTGRVRVIAVSTPERFRGLPDLPAVAETIPHFDCSSWYALIGPRGMEPRRIHKINEDLGRVIVQEDFVKRMMQGGVQPMASTPEGLRRHIVEEQDRWRRVIRSAGISSEVMN
jgi:tripartite-type tricarboxylate transporter receptor subunit TctC